MAKLSDRKVEDFIAQASPDAARAVKITRLEDEVKTKSSKANRKIKS